MKEYDREQRKWVDAEEVERKRSKRKLCKGGREHDFVLCLPSYIQHKDSVLGLDVAEEYYKIEDAREDADMAFDEKQAALGITRFTHSIRKILGRRRSYICLECGKRKY